VIELALIFKDHAVIEIETVISYLIENGMVPVCAGVYQVEITDIFLNASGVGSKAAYGALAVIYKDDVVSYAGLVLVHFDAALSVPTMMNVHHINGIG